MRIFIDYFLLIGALRINSQNWFKLARRFIFSVLGSYAKNKKHANLLSVDADLRWHSHKIN